ncbi:MAG TPA: hypothetical protein VID27_03615 [Blastocatellia bacterium]|jgi:hypothetical protein
MTWSEIKKAAEKAGIKEEDELSGIQCEPHHGNKSFHVLRLGRRVKLVEDFSEDAKKEASGCTC